MEQDGRFVAEQPGIYTVVAICGSHTARYSVLITSRDVAQRVEFVGHVPVRDRVTSDLWVWEGVDGRDYAVVGTWNAEGHAYFYDVTDPTNMEPTGAPKPFEKQKLTVSTHCAIFAMNSDRWSKTEPTTALNTRAPSI